MEKMYKPEPDKNIKINILAGIVIFFSIILISRLFYLQVLKHKTYVERAQYSTSRISILSAPRGNIYDRNGKVLATNKQAISAIVYPDKVKTIEQKIKTYKLLSKILTADKNKLKEEIFKLPDNSPLPLRLQSNITLEEAILIVENQNKLPGVEVQEEPIRYYPHGELASHVLGYISQISEKELEDRPERKMGDLVGKDGIEKIFDDILRGKDGKKIIEVDRFGKPIARSEKDTIIKIDPTSGRDIYLTIDIELQRALENALNSAGINGAVVAVNPNTGEVLALASRPSFDPNIFTKPIPSNLWTQLVKSKAFINRALLGYVPGSIWKPITLIAGLDAMVVKPGENFRVSGAVYLGSTRFGDWSSESGVFSIEKSLAWSRDTAFYQIGMRLKPEQIKYWGDLLGGGRKTGIELLGEEKGIIPDNEWKKKNVGEPWYPGNTLHYSIGQSFLLVTPVQVARMYSGIATGSKVPKLTLVKKIDKVIKEPEKPEEYNLNPAYMKIVHDGLEECIDSGTGQASKLEGIMLAGKTGSAEVPGSHKTHGWFASYGPSEKPEIVVIAFAEKAGHGGSVAAPIAKKVYNNYFGLDKPKEILLDDGTVISTPIPQVNSTVPKKKRFSLFRRKKT